MLRVDTKGTTTPNVCLVLFFSLFFSNRWFEKENHKEEQEGKEASALKLVKNTNTMRNASGSVWLALCVSPIKLGEVQNNLTG